MLLIDGLAYGAMPADVIRRTNAPIVALVHHPLCLEAGLTQVRQRELQALEQGALALAAHVVVTSATTAQTLIADFAVSADKITVAVPGTDAAPRAKGTGKPLQLLAVGSVVPRKAFDILVHAIAPLSGLDWRLSIVGSLDRSIEALATLKDVIARTELGDRITLVGPANQRQLDAHYDAADIFAMPSLYEGYGMVLAEAMARGLPIVCTTGGAAASTVPDAAGIKVPPGDIQAFSDAMGRLMSDPQLRSHMAEASWTAGRALPRWETTAMAIGPALPGGGIDPLFSIVFLGATIINIIPALLPRPTAVELSVVGVLHAAFLFRIVRARGAAARQRAVELESFKAVLSRERDRS